jgi:hypothetical protein
MNFRVALTGFVGWLLAVGVCEGANYTGAAAGKPLPGPALGTANTRADVLKDRSNPYGMIVERNIFHLNPEPPPPEPDVEKPDLPVIKISGFVKVGSRTRALFARVPKGPKDSWSYFNLAEGERDGILELVKISPDEKEAEVINSGTRMMLTVKDDGFSPAAAKGQKREANRLRPRELSAFGGGSGRGFRPYPPGNVSHANPLHRRL